jgi:hypothetical protein
LKRILSRLPGIPLLSFFDFFMESLRLFVEFQVCALSATDLYTRFEFLRRLCAPCGSRFSLPAKKILRYFF